ncbi:hypothetical protein [Nostoc sp.]|uniref:hypothetical protein n=1 Tax=Nostoc sp. TaxID=1180 RepID=UPI002FF6DE73
MTSLLYEKYHSKTHKVNSLAAASLTGGRAAFELHFPTLAGNEVLKEFQLKLTPMSIAMPLR